MIQLRNISFVRHMIRILGDIPLRGKMILFYAFLGIVPLMLISAFIYGYNVSILVENEKDLLQSSLRQAVFQLDSSTNVYNNLSDYLFNNQSISNAFHVRYDDNYYDMFLVQKNVVDQEFNTIISLHTDIQRLSLYTDSGFLRYKNQIYPLSDLAAEEWYSSVEDVHSPVWISDSSSTVILVRKLFSSASTDNNNYLCIELDYELFFAPLKNMFQNNYGIFVMNNENDLVYSFSTLGEGEQNNFSTSDFSSYLSDLESEYDNSFVILEENTEYQDWRVIFYRPLSSVKQSAIGILKTVFVVIWIIILIIAALSWVFSFVIVSPITALTKNIQKVEQSNFRATVKSSRKDEVGVLINSFAQMIDRINNLIQEVYVHNLEKKDYELKALRAQINPHFLYNSLSQINSRAITSGQTEISKMTLFLSRFYRTSLNKGKDMTTIENELENIKAYISVQQMLCNHTFIADYKIDENLLQNEMPNLILQPIVENSIEHGFHNSSQEEKHLSITLTQEGRDTVFKIYDNGLGILKELVPTLMQKESKGYGLKNVNERLLLIYGEGYGLKIESTLGEGTCVTIRTP